MLANLNENTVCVFSADRATHSEQKVPNSNAKIDENNTNLLLKTRDKNQLFKVIICTCLGLQQVQVKW